MTATSSIILIIMSVILLMPILSYPRIYEGVAIDGVDVSGYSREEVANLLLVWQKAHHEKSIVVYYGDMVVRIDAASIDFDINVNEAIDAAWNYGREGHWWERVQKIRSAKTSGYDIPLTINYNDVKLDQLMAQWQGMVERPPHNATLSMMTGGIIPEQQGCRLESDALRPLLLQAFMKYEDDAIALPVTTLYPEVTVTDITNTGIRQALSVYTTIFNSEDLNRTANIKLAAWKANGRIIYPGMTFSFNEIVGPREKANGFKEALEIVDGEFVPGIGGGICQLSSTLYNAAMLANLNMVERYNHSKQLSYVPLGRDATVSYNGLDFKFSNNTPGPIMIMAEVHGSKLMVGIFGQYALSETVEILSVDQEVIPPAIIKKYDANLYLGETKIDKQGKPGAAVTTVRVVRLNGQEVKREILSKDRYLPDDSIVKVGTQIPPFAREIQ